MNSQNSLLVLEYGGTARSGKGTIVSHLANTYDSVTSEETGADYRVVTSRLLSEQVVEPDMPETIIADRIQTLGYGALSEIVADRNNFVAEFGMASLYLPEVTDVVGQISPLQVVRKAAKAGFKKRVETVRDNGDHQVLLVDGRNLAPVIDEIPGTDLVMRTFVSCVESEGARRECLRKGLTPDMDEWYPTFTAELDRIQSRNTSDATRDIDPVRPDTDAIDYWHDTEAMLISSRLQSMSDGSYLEAGSSFDDNVNYIKWLTEKPHHKQRLREGVGSLACRDSVQIHFATDIYFGHYENPLEGMLTASRTMFEEAIGLRPTTDLLAKRDPASVQAALKVKLKDDYKDVYAYTDPMLHIYADAIVKTAAVFRG